MRTADTLIHFGGGVKVIKTDGDFVTLNGPGVVFDDPSAPKKDLVGDYFTKDSYYGNTKGNGSDVLFHHGLPVANLKFANEIADQIFPAVKVEDDETALMGSVIMDMREKYQQFLVDQARKNLLGWSTGAVGVQREADGWLKRWIIGEWSLTPTPAEPRTSAVPMKSLLLPDTKAVSLSGMIDRVHRAFWAKFDNNGWVSEVFDTEVVAEMDGKYYRIGYSNADGEVVFAQFSEWVEVEKITNWVEAKTFYYTNLKRILNYDHSGMDDLGLYALAMKMQNTNSQFRVRG